MISVWHSRKKKKMFKYWLVWLNMMRPQSCTYIFVSCFCRGRGKALKQAGGEGTRWQADGDTWVTSSWPGPAGVRGRARRGRAPKLPAPGGWSKSTVQLNPELWHEPHCSNAVSPCLEAKTRCKYVKNGDKTKVCDHHDLDLTFKSSIIIISKNSNTIH